MATAVQTVCEASSFPSPPPAKGFAAALSTATASADQAANRAIGNRASEKAAAGAPDQASPPAGKDRKAKLAGAVLVPSAVATPVPLGTPPAPNGSDIPAGTPSLPHGSESSIADVPGPGMIQTKFAPAQAKNIAPEISAGIAVEATDVLTTTSTSDRSGLVKGPQTRAPDAAATVVSGGMQQPLPATGAVPQEASPAATPVVSFGDTVTQLMPGMAMTSQWEAASGQTQPSAECREERTVTAVTEEVSSKTATAVCEGLSAISVLGAATSTPKGVLGAATSTLKATPKQQGDEANVSVAASPSIRDTRANPVEASASKTSVETPLAPPSVQMQANAPTAQTGTPEIQTAVAHDQPKGTISEPASGKPATGDRAPLPVEQRQPATAPSDISSGTGETGKHGIIAETARTQPATGETQPRLSNTPEMSGKAEIRSTSKSDTNRSDAKIASPDLHSSPATAVAAPPPAGSSGSTASDGNSAPQVPGKVQAGTDAGIVTAQPYRNVFLSSVVDQGQRSELRMNAGEVGIHAVLDHHQLSATLHVGESDLRTHLTAEVAKLESALAAHQLELSQFSVTDHGGSGPNREGQYHPPLAPTGRPQQEFRERPPQHAPPALPGTWTGPGRINLHA